MEITGLYYILINAILLIAAIVLIRLSKIKPRFLYRFSQRNNEKNDIFKDLKIGITLKQYKQVRFIFIFILLILIVIEIVQYKQYFDLSHIIIFLLLVIITTPKEKFFNISLPLFAILNHFSLKNMRLMDTELIRCLSHIKNIVNARKEKVSSDIVLSEIRRFSVNTRSILNKVIYYWDMGERKKACTYLKSNIKTEMSQIIADILLRFDELDRDQMLKEIDFYQERILSERETRIIKNRENRSFIVYALATLSIMLVIINFIIIVSYFDTVNMLKNII